MTKTNIQPSQIHDIAAAELRQIFIEAILYGFRFEILAEKVKISVGASGIDRQAYGMDILDHVIELRQPSIFTAKANKMAHHFAAALSLHWTFLEELSEETYKTAEDLAEIATFLADETIKSCAAETEIKPVTSTAEITQLSVKRPLRVQFEMAANILDDFDLEDYHLAGIVERENKLITLAEDMAFEIHSDKMPTDELKQIIHRQLTHGFNSLYFIGNHRPAPEHAADNFEVTKATIIDALSSRARELDLKL